MAKQNQGSGGKQKISLAPVKSLSQSPEKPETTIPVVTAPKPVIAETAVAKPLPAPSAPASAAPAPVVKPAVATAPVIAAPVKPTQAIPALVAATPAVKPAAVPAAVKPAALLPSAARIDPPKKTVVSPAPEAKAVATAPVVAVKPPAAVAAPKADRKVATTAMSFSIIPMHPGLTDFDAEMWFAPVVSAFRTFAAVQVKVLDHARAELQASFDEAEALARVASPSEAVAFQTKAFSRRIHAGSAHIADLAMTARKTGKAA